MSSMRGEDGSGKLVAEARSEAVPRIRFDTCIDRNGTGIDGISVKG